MPGVLQPAIRKKNCAIPKSFGFSPPRSRLDINYINFSSGIPVPDTSGDEARILKGALCFSNLRKCEMFGDGVFGTPANERLMP